MSNPPDNNHNLVADDEHAQTEAHESRMAAQKNEQYRVLKENARALFRTVKGLPGIVREEQWAALLKQTAIDIESGKFLLGRLGAKRYLDPELMAALVNMRQSLLDGLSDPTAGDIMLADSAIVAYRQMLRVQEWIDSICLVIERELFGQDPRDPVWGAERCEELERRIAQLQNDLVPLLERCQRMLIRALDRLDVRRKGQHGPIVAIGQAGQVNVDVR